MTKVLFPEQYLLILAMFSAAFSRFLVGIVTVDVFFCLSCA